MFIFGIILLVVIIYFAGTYNRLITLTSRAKEAWADIDVQLKRRYDLIPNIVSTVKGYATHEREAFENVTKARALAMGAKSVGEHAQAENQLSGALKSLFAISEAYPDLKANDNFLRLAEELADTENKIQAARRFYNTNVRDLIVAIESFPSNLTAKLFGFKSLSYFELAGDSKERENPKVSF
ncbi:MAG: LemA family protein [Patescibacteria group bacterium]